MRILPELQKGKSKQNKRKKGKKIRPAGMRMQFRNGHMHGWIPQGIRMEEKKQTTQKPNKILLLEYDDGWMIAQDDG